jgi:MFS family permease
LAPRDPWEDVAKAREQRQHLAARWIVAQRRRSQPHLPGLRELAPPRGPSNSAAAARRAMLSLAAGYFLSYLLRNVNGALAGDIVAELGIRADAFGQLTSAYFLAFAAAQLPVGVLLDRFGARLVQSLLLVCAAAGAALCALATDYVGQLLGRALIGLGTAGALVAGLKTSAAWFQRERLPLVNGAFIMCGGFGALAATWPIERALRGGLDWRAVYGVLALGALAVATVVAALVPRQRCRPAVTRPAPAPDMRLRDIVRHPSFQRFAPVSALGFGTVLAIQGLWAGPWLADVDGLSRPDVATDLAWMAVALIVAAPCWGVLTAWLRCRVELAKALAGAAALLIGCEAAIVAGCGSGAGLYMLPWCGFAFFGGMTVLSYSVVAEHFPAASLGRANAALNVLHVGASFIVQLLVGQVVALWTPVAVGRYPADAYRAALLAIMVAQAAALAWFAWPRQAATGGRIAP